MTCTAASQKCSQDGQVRLRRMTCTAVSYICSQEGQACYTTYTAVS